MQLFRDFPSGSNSFLHDAAYDYYGRRLASASSDHRIMIFDRDNSGSGGWKKSGEISRAHSGSILKIDWAHPEYGALLASCSTDRTAQIYQEIVEPKASTWKKQARLVDSRDAVTDVAFAPRHLGLRVATASLDGKIRIYESNDINNLSVWSPVDEFEAIKGGSAVCISWNSSPFDPPMIAVAADSTVKIWASSVSSKSSNSNKWTAICELSGHSDVVNDVAWAPNPGRTFHLIATASKDGFVRIFKISLKNNPAAADGNNNNNTTTSMVWECVARLGGHKSAVWRVSWNVIGTMLASSGDDGSTRIWKSDHRGQWQHVMIAAPNPLHYQLNQQNQLTNEQKSQPSIAAPSVSSSSFGVSAFSQGTNTQPLGSAFGMSGHTS